MLHGRGHDTIAATQLRAAVDASGEAIFLTDREGIFTFVNREFTRLYGHTSEEVVGKLTPRVLKGGYATPDEYAAFWRELLRKQVVRNEMINRTKAGAEVVIDSSANPVLDERGEIVGFLAIQRDVTEGKKLTEQLLHAQKMEAMGRLAGGIAHDFNNLLSVILASVDLIRDDGGDSTDIEPDLEAIRAAAERASKLTRQLSLFGRREPHRAAVVDINAVVDDVQQLVRRTIGEDVMVVCDSSASALPVLVDRGHLEQLLMNLVVNARDAMPEGGTITIRTRPVDLDAARSPGLPGILSATHAVIDVIDSGSGMSAEVASRAFDPFFTTKPAGKGTGLGLSIVSGIVKKTGGHVDIVSEEGRGTRVRVHLPLAAAPATRSTRPPGRAAKGKGETVLLVEDEEAVLALTGRLLLSSGYRVIAARDPAEAISLCEGGEDEVDVLLTDVVMPRMRGTQLAARLRKARPRMRVVLMSGYAEEVDLETESLGAELVAKPIVRDRLLDALRNALDDAVGGCEVAHSRGGAA